MGLSDEDRELLNEWLAAFSYTQVLELLARPRSEGGLEVRSYRASLSRYYNRVMPEWLAERRQRSLQIAKHFNATIEPGQFDLPTVEAVKQRTFETVLNPQANPGLLKTLLRTVLKMQDQQLAREKLDLATAKTIQADRIAQIEANGGNPFQTPVTQIETILKEQVAKRAAQPTPKPAPELEFQSLPSAHPQPLQATEPPTPTAAADPLPETPTPEPIPATTPVPTPTQSPVPSGQLTPPTASPAASNPSSAPQPTLDAYISHRLAALLAARSITLESYNAIMGRSKPPLG